jgi:hypothetical protein
MGRQILRLRRFGVHRRRCDGNQDSATCARVPGTLVRAVRAECLDWVLIFNQAHLHRVLGAYLAHYNSQR